MLANPLEFQRQWIDEHTADARRMRKPVVIEEFGKAVAGDDDALRRSLRDPVFYLVGP